MTISDFLSTCLGILTVIEVYKHVMTVVQRYPEDEVKLNIAVAGTIALMAGVLVFVLTNALLERIQVYR